jgi:CBS domain containing-hemolysin-like protein
MERSAAEMWVKIISIIGIVFSAIVIAIGIISLIGGAVLGAFLGLLLGKIIGAIAGTALIILGILAIAYGIFSLIVAVNLMHYKNWARIVFIVFAAIGIVSGLFSLPVGLLKLAINGGIFYLLAIDKEVIALFKK